MELTAKKEQGVRTVETLMRASFFCGFRAGGDSAYPPWVRRAHMRFCTLRGYGKIRMREGKRRRKRLFSGFSKIRKGLKEYN